MRAASSRFVSMLLLASYAASLLPQIHTAERNEAYRENDTLDFLVAKLPALREHIYSRHNRTRHQEEALGAGIVISGGKEDLFAKALIIVKMLRKELDCQLPIEIAYFSNSTLNPLFKEQLEHLERNEGMRFLADVLKSAVGPENPLRNVNKPKVLSPAQQEGPEIEENVRLRDLGPIAEKLGLTASPKRFTSLARIISIHKSPFDQVIYLDAEALPLYNPAQMLEWDLFKTQGAMFWSNFNGVGVNEVYKEVLWSALGLEAPWRSNSDWRNTDQNYFLIDRRRHADVVEWATFLCLFNHMIYEYLADTDDPWEIAFALADKLSQYQKSTYPPRAALGYKHEEVYDLLAMVQNSPEGLPVWIRRTGRYSYELTSQPDSASTQWLTIGLPDAGWRAFSFHDESQSFGIHDQSTIYPDDIACDSVDLATARLLSELEPFRWQDCSSNISSLERKLPVALIPLTNYPAEFQSRLTGIERVVTSLQSLSSAKSHRWSLPVGPDESSSSQTAQESTESNSAELEDLKRERTEWLGSATFTSVNTAKDQSSPEKSTSTLDVPTQQEVVNKFHDKDVAGLRKEAESSQHQRKSVAEKKLYNALVQNETQDREGGAVKKELTASRVLNEGSRNIGHKEVRTKLHRQRKRSERFRTRGMY